MPARQTFFAALSFGLLVAFAAAPAWAKPQVQVIVLAESSPSTASSSRRWAQTFADLGVGVQVRGSQPGETIGIEVRGSGDSATYYVTGQLNANNELVLPGGRFAPGDRDRLAKWLGELGTNGPAGVTEKRSAFGLLPKQIADVRDDLAQPVSFSTKKTPPTETVAKIAAGLKFPLTIDADVQQALAADDPVRDELEGIASGTALAAIARPAGAVLRPRQEASGALSYMLVKAAPGSEGWPIGWPAQEAEAKVLPQLVDSLNAEIRDVSLSQAVGAIQSRLKVPFLWDYNALVKQRIDVSKNITVPGKRAIYAILLRQVLFQGQLKYSLRVDDAGKPLIWITTVKSQ
jgi:hypothetical protein